ncbi:MAG TPA: gliding motility-associated C-terminal domain-containing protein, partial [Chitinophagales bacterium]|nr:gliding motility-associated C-terminal domain-containing protein [Chitinophagales bacterium]
YEWSSNLLNNGNSFIWPYNPLYVTLNPNVLPGDYRFYVQEINYGCVGPSSAPAIVTIIGPPSTHINGPLVVCLGDTVDYNVTYLRDTYYQWRSSNGVQILDASNSESRMIFDSLGTFTISNIVTNRCITGNDTGTYTVTVISPYTVNLGPDQRVCQYTPLNLTAQSNSLNKGLLTQTTGRQTTPGGMFNIIAHDDVTIDSFAVIFNGTHTNLQEQIYGKQGSYRGSETNVGAWSFNTSYFNFATSGLNQLTTIPAYIGQHLAPGDTFAYYLVNVNSPVVSQYYDNGIGIQQGTVYSSDGVIDIVQGTVNSSLFGAFVGPYILDLKVYYSTKAGEHFIWNTGDTTATILFNPTHDTTLVVTLYDTSGCRNTDTLNIAVDIVPIVDAGPDTLLCPLVNYTMQGTSNNPNINWQPAAGLSNTNTLNPVFNYYQTQRYFLIATDTLGCNGTDSVLISVDRIDVDAGPDTTICDGETFQLAGSSSADNIVWSPATGLSDVSILAPVFSADHGGVYLLSATDTLGCTLSDSVSIEVKICDTYIQVPSAFTPNGDGNNDFFTVFGKYISDYEIRIYNRWGEEVYHSTDLNELSDLSRGWDGTYKGKKQDSGTFVYYIVAKDINGKTITKKGNLTLIR